MGIWCDSCGVGMFWAAGNGEATWDGDMKSDAWAKDACGSSGYDIVVGIVGWTR